MQALTEEYNKVGHVPYKEDKLYEAYHEVLDRIYKELNISTKRRRLNDFKANIKNVAKRGEEALDNERGRLVRRFDQLKQEIQTYENNLGFLNASSKKRQQPHRRDEPQGTAPARRPRTGSPEDKGYRRRKQINAS